MTRQIVGNLLEMKDCGSIDNEGILSILFGDDHLPVNSRNHRHVHLLDEISKDIGQLPKIAFKRELMNRFIKRLIDQGKKEATAKKAWQRAYKKYSAK